jgi:glycyl-tRNA synthetase alpha subunit
MAELDPLEFRQIMVVTSLKNSFYHFRISDAEMIAKRKQEETNKALQDLNNLKSALSNYEAALNIERREHQNAK